MKQHLPHVSWKVKVKYTRLIPTVMETCLEVCHYLLCLTFVTMRYYGSGNTWSQVSIRLESIMLQNYTFWSFPNFCKFWFSYMLFTCFLLYKETFFQNIKYNIFAESRICLGATHALRLTAQMYLLGCTFPFQTYFIVVYVLHIK